MSRKRSKPEDRNPSDGAELTAGRHIPERKCVSCGGHFPKSALIRVVRTADGKAEIDLTGKADGRGAYLCTDPKCLAAAKKARRLERALSVRLPEDLYDRLTAILEKTE
ncbi:MAG: YlxR family protein [Clostridia bacterium]|nr:YlxR family protein [Clostridia bacterium]